MTQIQGYNSTNQQINPAMYNTTGQVLTNNIPLQANNANGITPIYQYPATSLYTPQGMGQVASGVNINIYNPSGMGGTTPTGYYPLYSQAVNTNQQPLPAQQIQQDKQAPVHYNMKAPDVAAAAPMATTPTEPTLQKSTAGDLIELNDDLIKSIENYLRSENPSLRKTGITKLIKLFEGNTDRYDNPSLNALLNIALQDPDYSNRIYAMVPITTGSAHGDDNTAGILKKLLTSDKSYGQEAQMANEALLNCKQPN